MALLRDTGDRSRYPCGISPDLPMTTMPQTKAITYSLDMGELDRCCTGLAARPTTRVSRKSLLHVDH